MRKLLCTVIFSTCMVVLVSAISGCIAFFRIEPMETHYTKEQYNYVLSRVSNELKPVETSRTNEEYRKIIEKDFKCGFYFYREAKLPSGVIGKCYAMINVVLIDPSLSGYNYCQTLAHELIHKTRFIGQENYVNYLTFRYLYEHSDPEFHNFGVNFAMTCLLEDMHEDYDCRAQIIKYFLA